MSETLNYRVSVDGTENAKAEVQEVAGAVGRAQGQANAATGQAERANRRHAQSFNDIKEKAETAVRVIDRTVRTIGELNQRYVLMSRESAIAVSHLGELTSRIQEQGLAAATVTTTIEMMTEAWASAGWIERRSQQTMRGTQTLEEYRAAAGRMIQTGEQQARIQNTVAGATQELQAAQLRHLDLTRQLVTVEAAETRGTHVAGYTRAGVTRQLTRQTEEVQRLTQALNALTQAEEAEANKLKSIQDARERAERARAAAERARAEAERRQRDEQAFFDEAQQARDERATEDFERRLREQAFLASQVNEWRAEMARLDQESLDAQLERHRAAGDKLLEDERAAREKLGEEKRRQAEEAVSAMREAQASIDNISTSIAGTFTNAISGAVDAWLSGTKSFEEAAADMVKGVLKALVSESIVQAIVETARGIAALASYRYDAAALHFAAAGTWAAVGVTAGVVGAAVGAFGGGGGGGAQGGARDTSSAAAQPSSNAGGGVTINLYAPNAIMTEAERGAMIAQSMREARRQLGPAVVRA